METTTANKRSDLEAAMDDNDGGENEMATTRQRELTLHLMACSPASFAGIES
jgi:hypothetical protein